jgi:hypothetical protein
MKIPRFVLGFYRSGEHAEEARLEARKHGFRQSAVVHRAVDGRLRFFHTGMAPGGRAALSVVVGILLALAAGFFGANLGAQILVGVGGFAGGWLGTLAVGFGFRKTVRDRARYVFPGESMVIVQVAEQRTKDAVAALRRIGHMALFVLRPGLQLNRLTEHEPSTPEPVATAGLPECASELAESHQPDTSKKSRSLLPILRKYEEGIEGARSDLAGVLHPFVVCCAYKGGAVTDRRRPSATKGHTSTSDDNVRKPRGADDL